ncbi:MAG: hypothetical protein IJ421_00620 [Prevotella sp.]|nr:hypothetical protein [Prevotella sp.]MBQ8627961.1 hypothetical protein [Prevotella sp.]
MGKRIFLVVSFLMTILCVNAQKAIVTEEEYVPIRLNSIPEDAKVYYEGKLISTTTPAIVRLPLRAYVQSGKKKDRDARMRRSADASAIELVFKKDGYRTGTEILKPIIHEDGKKYEVTWPESVIHEFAESHSSEYRKDPTIPKGEYSKRVNRDNPGSTSLERTIIRWYFDSAPQGARIFWRVISSVPSEVKNTNETWLGSTPFEETRSFNIQGLTYANSRDVQIEIKVKRKGYIDQNKRFNVRQAIDQQEISSFFDMVPVEE